MNCVDEAENHEIQADRGQLTAKERNFSQGSLEPVGATVEQLAAEEQTIRQERKKARDGDTIQEEDFEQAAEEGSTQENVLKQKKKTEVSWVENKGYFTRQRQFYFSDSYGFLKLERHF